MDLDGNGWSDRYARLVAFPTPILKQATNHTAFFEHLLAPGHALEHFDNVGVYMCINICVYYMLRACACVLIHVSFCVHLI